MAQPGRALVRATYRKATTPWRPTAAPANCRTPSALTSTTITAIPNPSSGPKPPTKSSNRSPDFVNAFLTQDTSAPPSNARVRSSELRGEAVARPLGQDFHQARPHFPDVRLD